MYFDDDTMGDGGIGGSFNPDGSGQLGGSGSNSGSAGLGGSYSGGSGGGYIGGSYGSSGGSNNGSGVLVGAGLGGSFSARDVVVEAVIDPSTGILQYLPVVGGIDVAYQNYNVQNEIATALQQRGWSVLAVTDTGFSFGSGRKFQIKVGVGSDYSDTQIVNGMRSDLASVGTVGSVSIVSQSSAKYVNPDVGGSQARFTGSSEFLSSLGLGLGVSTPLVIGAAVLFIVLIARR